MAFYHFPLRHYKVQILRKYRGRPTGWRFYRVYAAQDLR